MVVDEDIRAAYEAAKGRWTHCDWPTDHGCLGLDLNGFSAAQARGNAARWQSIAGGSIAAADRSREEEALLLKMAKLLGEREAVVYLIEDGGVEVEVRAEPALRLAAEMVAEEWESAAKWLEQIEADAAWAEEEAQWAVAAADQGDWGPALRHACGACAIESEYETAPHWSRLRQVIEEAVRQSPWGARCGLQQRGGIAVRPASEQ